MSSENKFEYVVMTTESSSWDKTAAYLSGDLSEPERKSFEAWIAASDKNRIQFEDAKLLWSHSQKKLVLTEDTVDDDWDALEPKLNVRHFSLWNITTKVAASIAIIAVAYYLFVLFTTRNVINVSSGNQVATIYLPDSTKVWLNANSTLSYPKDFSGDRMVTLDGEACFKVRKTGSRFYVNTDFARVEVLGTTFHLAEDSSGAKLVVAEGKVKFALITAAKEGQIISSGEQALITENGTLTKSKITDKNFATWRKISNPEYEVERLQAEKFLKVKFSWRKNGINQSRIEGTVLNTASLADYKNIELKITYSNLKEKSKTVALHIHEPLRSGSEVKFSKKLTDIFKDTQHLEIVVVRATAE